MARPSLRCHARLLISDQHPPLKHDRSAARGVAARLSEVSVAIRRVSRPLAWVVVLLTLLSAGFAGRRNNAPVGVQPDGSILVPNGQALTPAGQHVEVNDRPLAIAVAPTVTRSLW